MRLFEAIKIRDSLEKMSEAWLALCNDSDNCHKCKYEHMCNATDELAETFTTIVTNMKAEFKPIDDTETYSYPVLVEKIKNQRAELARLNNAIKEYQNDNLALRRENTNLEKRLRDVDGSVIGLQNRIENLKQLNKILATSRYGMFGKGGK